LSGNGDEKYTILVSKPEKVKCSTNINGMAEMLAKSDRNMEGTAIILVTLYIIFPFVYYAFSIYCLQAKYGIRELSSLKVNFITN
jgi:hypothetical protein